MDVKIYDLDYLINEELTEEDLYNLFETASLNYSLVIAMFRCINDKRSDDEIIEMCKTDDRWVYKNYWKSEKQKEEFKEDLKKIIKNVYQAGEIEQDRKASWWMFQYSLSIPGQGDLYKEEINNETNK